MKKIKIIGLMIALVEFVILVGIILFVYKGIFVNGIVLLFLVLLFRPFFYKVLMKKKGKELIRMIVLVNVIVLFVFYLLLPKYTYNEAKGMIMNAYKNDSYSFNQFKPYNKNTVLVDDDGSKGLFSTKRFYYFSFTKDGTQIDVMVSPVSGEIVEISK